MKSLLTKTLLQLLLFNLLAVGICKAQGLIDYTQVGLMKADYDHRAVLYIGNSQKKAIAILGAPSSTSTYYSEMRNTNLSVLHYGNNKLYFEADALVLCNIEDPTIAVGKSYSTSFRIGSNRGGGATFHGLPVNTTSGKSRNLNYSAIAFGNLKSGGTPLDYGFEALFDASGNVFNICILETN